mmetsp:Transcript_35847/g.114816  ORF Transcript_35847/g.114816 Transcript_35847/m.114816 type:complete len:373 (-) Transcript_35847:198-1316(-)
MIGVGIVQPLLLSLVADKNPPTKRGSAFGSIYFTGAVCNTLFTYVATKYSVENVAGIDGWRISVLGVALFSAFVGLLIHLLGRKHYSFLGVFTQNMPKVWSLFKYPTFVLILCQGAPGTAPWTVFPFFTQWLELSCFTRSEAAFIFSAFGWGLAFCVLLRGILLNFVSRRFPDHGPPAIANFSVAIGTPFLVLVFFCLPKPESLGAGSEYVLTYAVAFWLFGLGASMCGTVNRKVFSDIVPANILTYVFAIDQLIENGLGNFAALAVGLLTDVVFKYDKTAVEEGDCSPEQAAKLGLGMFAVCSVAWIICFTVYLGTHWTYPKDRVRQLQLRSAELESGKKGEGTNGRSSVHAEEEEKERMIAASPYFVKVE